MGTFDSKHVWKNKSLHGNMIVNLKQLWVNITAYALQMLNIAYVQSRLWQ